MWSRRFLWVGIGSGFVVASIAVAAIWLVMRAALSLTFPLDLASYAICCAVGILVYPPLWALFVFARRSYTRATTYGSIKSILQNGLDRAFTKSSTPDASPIRHANIRGRGYYH